MTSAERKRREAHNRKALAAIAAERVRTGVCRHCGGPLPCLSEFGDRAPGERHTAASLRAARKNRS